MAPIEDDESVTLPPAQKVVGLPVIVGVAGRELTVAVTAVLVDDTHPVVLFRVCA